MTEREQRLEQALIEAKRQLKEQAQVLKTLEEAGTPVGLVIAEADTKLFVMPLGGGMTLAVERHPAAQLGQLVVLGPPSNQIVGLLSDVAIGGRPGTVKAITSDHVEVDTPDGVALIPASRGIALEKGDRVMVDTTGHVMLRKLPHPVTHTPLTAPVAWDDIKGQPEAVRAIRDLAEMTDAPALYAAYGRTLPKGVLLYGPPGNGKTMLAKALATALSAGHAAPGFFAIKGPEILSKWVGESEAAIRHLFTQARRFKAAHGRPAVIFIDEADAILGQRGRHTASGMEATLVPQFLSEMDGIEESCAVSLLATNRPKDLDVAVLREGRVDLKVLVGHPTREHLPSYFAHYLATRPVADDVTVLADQAAEFVVTTKTLVSGASVATAVEMAAALAFDRDRAAHAAQPSGITLADLSQALTTIKAGNAATTAA